MNPLLLMLLATAGGSSEDVPALPMRRLPPPPRPTAGEGNDANPNDSNDARQENAQHTSARCAAGAGGGGGTPNGRWDELKQQRAEAERDVRVFTDRFMRDRVRRAREVPPLKRGTHRVQSMDELPRFGESARERRVRLCPRRHVSKGHERVCELCRTVIPAIGPKDG